MAEDELKSSQRPVDSLPDELWDVVIVGAGPAGSTAAIHLASHGHRVLLVDKERFPREKTCGDVLLFDAIQCLRRLGLYERVRAMAHEVATLSSFSPSRVEVEVTGEFLTLRRLALDALLARTAVDAGAAFSQGEACDVKPGAGGAATASFVGSARTIRARIGVIATGARVALAKRLGLISRATPSAVGIRCYVRSPFPLDRLIAFYDPRLLPGYAWIFPMGNNEYNVGCCAFRREGHGTRKNLKRALENLATELPPAKALFQQGEIVGPIQGAMARCGLRGAHCLVKGNVLAIGETIGSTLPFTGEGVGGAMETAELAASTIHEALDSGRLDKLADYPAQVEEKLLPRHMAYEIAQGWASRRWLNDFLARRIRKNRWLQDTLASVVSADANSRAVFFLRRAFRLLARLRGAPS